MLDLCWSKTLRTANIIKWFEPFRKIVDIFLKFKLLGKGRKVHGVLDEIYVSLQSCYFWIYLPLSTNHLKSTESTFVWAMISSVEPNIFPTRHFFDFRKGESLWGLDQQNMANVEVLDSCASLPCPVRRALSFIIVELI